MKNREQYKKLLSLFAAAMIILLQTAVFRYVWHTSYKHIGANYFVSGNYVLIALYALMVFFFGKLTGGFQIHMLRIFDLLFTQIFSTLCVNIITYLQLCLIGRWTLWQNITPIVYMTLAQLLIVIAWSLFVRWLYTKLYPPKRMLLVYGAYSPDNLLRNISSRKDKYAIKEMISIDEDLDLIKKRILHHGNVIMTDIPADLRNHLLKFCFAKGIKCYCVPKISDIMIQSAPTINMFDTSLLVFRNMGLSADQRFFKRLFDIAASLIIGILILPLILIIALLIKIFDNGPVFFKQDRLTKDGKVFKVIKFRSMKVRKDDEPYCLTRKNDSRITPIGKFLRASHLDELPQIFNILKGDMSFVGPRPETPELADTYKEIVPEFDFRLKVRAGLTGYAQVFGRYNTTPYDKLKLDLAYIDKYSFLFDLKLIVLTIKVLFQKENTEGIEEWQTSAASKDQIDKIGSK